jgi:hypothetical protein
MVCARNVRTQFSSMYNSAATYLCSAIEAHTAERHWRLWRVGRGLRSPLGGSTALRRLVTGIAASGSRSHVML